MSRGQRASHTVGGGRGGAWANRDTHQRLSANPRSPSPQLRSQLLPFEMLISPLIPSLLISFFRHFSNPQTLGPPALM